MNTLALFQQPRRGILARDNRRSFFDSFFDDFATFPRTTFSQYPTTKVNNFDDRCEINVIVPGLNKEDLSVSLDDQTLTISYESPSEDGNTTVSYSSFIKSWTLPKGTTEKDINAGYDSGVLTVSVNKTIPVKIPVKIISIK
tara:strand:- start:2103 stop:2528 length:426 start_codon:yes stop_codon:yes gene_type:complete